jgi:hypothetical protein
VDPVTIRYLGCFYRIIDNEQIPGTFEYLPKPLRVRKKICRQGMFIPELHD